MEVLREFCPGNRYLYDFGACSYVNGWVQIDTKDDASYYGNWTHPTRLEVFSYVEGDTTLTRCTTVEEYVLAVRTLAA